ncbi:hypothetical protein K1T71_009552 [Dendrolimus kikuchii]|uniref:Uncharacterized protein n=1 Tax=Dendrolimus kikuchii TaxID=765133 RepID=A0ACC1CSR1_9NEOP|nr:hypothetical protein K1T71_009552 [Dendrolimus kikuchii]
MPYKQTDDLEDVHVPRYVKVFLGGIAGMMATTLVQPFDVVKVRMQVYEKPITTIRMGTQIVKCEGFKALYAGLTAGLLRQATYTTTRLSCYNWLYAEFKRKHAKDPELRHTIIIGIYAGLAGAFVGNPAEVLLVRLMADGPKKPCDPNYAGKQYKGIIDAICKVIKEEGVSGLWRGGSLTLIRSIFVSTAQIGTYSKVRQAFREQNIGKGIQMHFYTSVITSFLVAVVSLPVDVVKTLYQVKRELKRTQSQIIRDLIKDNGIGHFWQGFLPYFLRLTFHTFVTFYLLEKMNKHCRNYLQQQKNIQERKR